MDGTFTYANGVIEDIKTLAKKDAERSHGMEDELHFWALSEISHGHPDPIRLAALVLQTQDIKFPRSCA